MVKGGLSKLRCMIRRWHSSSRISRDEDDHGHGSGDGNGRAASFHGADEVPKGLHPVYVGKSRRRYLVAEELVGHPMFQTLVDRTAGGVAGGTVVGCEVGCCSSTCCGCSRTPTHSRSLSTSSSSTTPADESAAPAPPRP